MQGYASGKDATAWCSKYGLTKTKKFTFQTYGETVTRHLAEYWCSCMQHFYNFGRAEGGTDVFTNDEIASAPGPEATRAMMAGDAYEQAGQAKLLELASLVPCAPSSST